MDITKIAIKGTTQDHLQLADIVDDLVILKDGSVALIIQVSAVNFGLLSEQEQESIIFAYAGLLNSLNFSIQIVIRSQQKDVSAYMALLEEAREKQKNPLLATQIEKYRDFIASTVKNNNVLDKKFYIAIPFSFLELGVASNAGGLFKKKQSGLPLPAETIVEKAKTALLPKRDHILRQLGRLGLRAKQLTTSELIDLFYDIYNHHTAPTDAETAAALLTTNSKKAAAAANVAVPPTAPIPQIETIPTPQPPVPASVPSVPVPEIKIPTVLEETTTVVETSTSTVTAPPLTQEEPALPPTMNVATTEQTASVPVVPMATETTLPEKPTETLVPPVTVSPGQVTPTDPITH